MIESLQLIVTDKEYNKKLNSIRCPHCLNKNSFECHKWTTGKYKCIRCLNIFHIFEYLYLNYDDYEKILKSR